MDSCATTVVPLPLAPAAPASALPEAVVALADGTGWRVSGSRGVRVMEAEASQALPTVQLQQARVRFSWWWRAYDVGCDGERRKREIIPRAYLSVCHCLLVYQRHPQHPTPILPHTHPYTLSPAPVPAPAPRTHLNTMELNCCDTVRPRGPPPGLSAVQPQVVVAVVKADRSSSATVSTSLQSGSAGLARSEVHSALRVSGQLVHVLGCAAVEGSAV